MADNLADYWLDDNRGLQGILVEGIEHGGEVALTRVGEQGYNLLALVLGTLGNLGGCKGGCSAADADEESFLLGELAAGEDGGIVLYGQYLVDVFTCISLGHETCTDALNLVGTARIAAQYGGRSWLYGHNLHVGILLLEGACHAGDGSAGTYASHEDVDLAVGLIPDFLTGGLIVALRVGRILKLLQDDRAGNGVAQFVGGLDGT